MVSIIVPVYNVEMYLTKCVSSLIKQTYSDLQIILVDDGSIDNSSQICDKFASKDSRIEVIHKINGGLSDARNEGLSQAIGDYCCFVDSDDYISPYMIEKLLKAAEETDADIVVCGYTQVNAVGKVIAEIIFPFSIEDSPKSMERLARSEDGISMVWNKLFRRKVFNDCHFPVGKIHEDEFIMHRLIGNSKTICYIANALYFYVVRSNSITSNKRNPKHIDKGYAYIDRYNYFLSHGFDNLKDYALIQCYGALLCELKCHSYFSFKKLYNPIVLFLMTYLKSPVRKIRIIINVLISLFKK